MLETTLSELLEDTCLSLTPHIIIFFSHCTAWECRVLVPQPGIEPVPPAVVEQSLNHCTAREVPFLFFLIHAVSVC